MSSNHIMPLETAKIKNNIYAVRTGSVNFFLLKTDHGYICFDSGFRTALIKKGLDSLGIDPMSITHLFLTHSDFDHTGGINLFKNADIYLSIDEVPMITHRKARMFGVVHNFKITRDYKLLHDNDTVTDGSTSIRAIATPGHTPGSMCFLVNDSLLFAGDTLMLIDDKIFPLRRSINMDTELQKESIRKLAQLNNVSLVFTGHFGYTEKFNEAMKYWI